MGHKAKGRAARLRRQTEALARQEQRDEMGDAVQLTKLRGNGHGHCKEAQRLEKAMKKKKTAA